MYSVKGKEVVLEAPSNIKCSLYEEDTLYLACERGEILEVKGEEAICVFKCNGQPNGLAYDKEKQTYYVTDIINQVVLAHTEGQEHTTILMKDYEGVPLVGPHSLTLSKKTGNLFLTDCGYFGETDVQNKHGSVFLIDMEQGDIRPLSLRCLSMPTGLVLSRDEKTLFVCEMGCNRLLRYFQNQQGIFYSSVFHQFSGRMGPSSITANWDLQLLFVSLFEFKSLSHEAIISVVSLTGEALARVQVTAMSPEIRSLQSGSNHSGKLQLYLAEEDSNECKKITLEVDGKEEKHS